MAAVISVDSVLEFIEVGLGLAHFFPPKVSKESLNREMHFLRGLKKCIDRKIRMRDRNSLKVVFVLRLY